MIFKLRAATLPELEEFMVRLLGSDWEAGDGAIHFCADLPLAALSGAAFFQNARIFLKALDRNGGTGATEAGNLNRAFVQQVFDELDMPAPRRESILQVCKVVNETDAWELHLARVVSECAGLVSRRKKRFQLTRLGASLLSDEKCGELFWRLFMAYFRRFNLSYDFNLRTVPGIQQSMAVVLWRLDAVAREWTAVRGLAEMILLPAVHAELRGSMVSQWDREEWILAGYVLNPLLNFGLIEKKKPGDWPGVDEKDSIRVTGLWRSFVSFRVPGVRGASGGVGLN
ncbi:MAG: hypothetical protein AB1705_21460 [Verrucomicrobiota bacterium]